MRNSTSNPRIELMKLFNRIEAAKRNTLAVANMKDYQCRSKHLREQRQKARELVEKNGGYIIDLKLKAVGCFHYNNVWKSIGISYV